MNRPGINISMFGVFTTDSTVFVVFDLMFRPKAQRLQKASKDHDRTWFPRQVAHLSFISIIVTNLPAFLSHATISR